MAQYYIMSKRIVKSCMGYKCPCCGNYTLHEKPPGTYEVYTICSWEDDEVQYNDPTYVGGANKMCLNDARKMYASQSND